MALAMRPPKPAPAPVARDLYKTGVPRKAFPSAPGTAVITPSTIVSRKTAIVDSTLDGEVLALDLDAGETFVFDGTAKAIWELTKEPIAISAICARLCEAYDIAAERCLAEVVSFVEALAKQDVLVLSEP